jgi:hypothetical protein
VAGAAGAVLHAAWFGWLGVALARVSAPDSEVPALDDI